MEAGRGLGRASQVTTVLFSHGQESGPWGTKIRAMAARVEALGLQADSIDYRGIADPSARIDVLIAACRAIDDRLILVGSSLGGHVATAAASSVRAAGLFVLAPAWYLPGLPVPTPPGVPICIVHGWRDEIVPVDNSIRFARQCLATLHLVDGDHRLTANIDDINNYLEHFIGTLAER